MNKAKWLVAALCSAAALFAGATSAQAQTMHFGEGQSNLSDAPPPPRHRPPPPRHHRHPPPPPRHHRHPPRDR